MLDENLLQRFGELRSRGLIRASPVFPKLISVANSQECRSVVPNRPWAQRNGPRTVVRLSNCATVRSYELFRCVRVGLPKVSLVCNCPMCPTVRCVQPSVSSNRPLCATVRSVQPSDLSNRPFRPSVRLSVVPHFSPLSTCPRIVRRFASLQSVTATQVRFRREALVGCSEMRSSAVS
jgi:hypothetical protein